MPRTRRDRRQQARETAKLAAELASAQRCPIARVSARIAQPARPKATTATAPDLTVEDEEVQTRRGALGTNPESLLPVDARLPDDLKRLRDAVDDDADLFTRDPRGWRLG
jgi:hypothetical protein